MKNKLTVTVLTYELGSLCNGDLKFIKSSRNGTIFIKKTIKIKMKSKTVVQVLESLIIFYYRIIINNMRLP